MRTEIANRLESMLPALPCADVIRCCSRLSVNNRTLNTEYFWYRDPNLEFLISRQLQALDAGIMKNQSQNRRLQPHHETFLRRLLLDEQRPRLFKGLAETRARLTASSSSSSSDGPDVHRRGVL